MSIPAHHRMTIPEYIAFEETSEVRHEFFDGEIFAMSGGSPEHAFIKENLSVFIGGQLRGKPCRSASSDLRVRVEETGFHTYPDVLIVCGEPRYAEDDRHSLLNPVVIFEVLSPSTEKHDRTFKLDHYRKIPSLKQYVLVAQDQMRVESYTPNEAGWSLQSFTEPDQMLRVVVGEITVPLSEIYDRIVFSLNEEAVENL